MSNLGQCGHALNIQLARGNEVCILCLEDEVAQLREQINSGADYSDRLSRQLAAYRKIIIQLPFKHLAVMDADPIAIPERKSLTDLLDTQARYDALVAMLTTILHAEIGTTGDPEEIAPGTYWARVAHLLREPRG